MSNFLPAFPHGEIEEVFPDVFWVRGSFRMWPGAIISRNMTIVRAGSELTLVNSVRLNADGEAALEELGVVKHVVRLGSFHGADDPYYAHRYGATVWAQDGQRYANGFTAHRRLREGDALPLRDAELVELPRSKRPEATLVLGAHGGVLVACDAVQHFVDFSGCSAMCKLMLHVMGFKKPANIGPGFKMSCEDKKHPLAPDFRRILEHPFRHLLPAHGVVLRDAAHEQLTETIARVYG